MDVPMPESRPLREDIRVDACVVGAGIAGISTAHRLIREGKQVAVLDAGALGGGETSRTTAHLASAIDDRFTEIERLHGADGARICAESHAVAIDTIERMTQVERIDCDFERIDGYLFGGGEDATASLTEELEAARRAGVEGVVMLPRPPLETMDAGDCLRFPRQGQFHPLKYLRALAQAIVRDGGRLHTGTLVADVEEGQPARVITDGGPVVTADDVVVATNSPFINRFAIHTKQAPYRTYAVAAQVPRGAVPRGLYWDTLDPYHYVRLAPSAEEGEELLIVGGEDRKPGDDADHEGRFEELEGWARERFPTVGNVVFRWSGQVMEPVDGVAFIGRNPGGHENIYVATGDSGMGMTHGTIAGLLITDLIMGRTNPWARLYDPSRVTLGAVGKFLREGAGVVGRMAEWFRAGDVETVDDIGPGSGGILRRGMTKVAVYRDPEGRLHEFSAACTHLGCVVAWNPIAASWDCPCHGSRFDPYGRVLAGPAVAELKRVPVS
jgi:glycine/D-amino acid oxidase-like deaminating enzyme/nitrite reductase/ring-hydroxylating ferredoxin subunit